jgi:XRE family transcriptional regulator, regulator of sulfur utilization
VASKRRDPATATEGTARGTRHKRPTPMDLETLALNIRSLRNAAGWAQEELAQEANLARSHVGALELQKLDPRLSTLGAIAAAFKVQTSDLLRLPAPKAKKRTLVKK